MAEFVDESCREVTGDLDGPACTVCGAIMVRLENKENSDHFVHYPDMVWKCLSCGTETRPL